MYELDNLKSTVDKIEQLEATMRRLMYGSCRLCGEPLTKNEQTVLTDQCHECTDEVAD